MNNDIKSYKSKADNFLNTERNFDSRSKTMEILKNGVSGGRIVYEDPAAVLNISDEKWAKIVNENK